MPSVWGRHHQADNGVDAKTLLNHPSQIASYTEIIAVELVRKHSFAVLMLCSYRMPGAAGCSQDVKEKWDDLSMYRLKTLLGGRYSF